MTKTQRKTTITIASVSALALGASLLGGGGSHALPQLAALTKTVHADDTAASLTPKSASLSKSILYQGKTRTQIQLAHHDDTYGYQLDATIPVNAVQKSLTISDPMEPVQSFTLQNIHIYDGTTDITKDGQLNVSDSNGHKTFTWTAGANEINKLKSANNDTHLRAVVQSVSLKGDTIGDEAKYTNGKDGLVSIPNQATLTIDAGCHSDSATLLQNGITGMVVNHRLQLTVPHNELDNTISAAQQAGVQLTKGDDVQHSVDFNDGAKTEKTIQNDYAQQVNQLKNDITKEQQIKQQNAAAKNQVSSADVDAMANKLKAAGVNVTQDKDGTITGSTADYQSDSQKVQNEYQQMVKTGNNALSQYQSKMADYQKAEQKYNDDLAGYNRAVAGLSQKRIALNGIQPNQIAQKLVLKKEPDAQMSYKLLNNSDAWTAHLIQPAQTPNGYNNTGNGQQVNPPGVDSKSDVLFEDDNQSNGNGELFQTTFTNLHNSSYDGKPISKVVETFSDADFTNANRWKGEIFVYSDPTDGIWFLNTRNITEKIQFYDNNGNLIHLNNNNAYITIESLNNHDNNGKNTIEEAQLLSPGQAYQISGSSVTVHPNNTLYSDNNNTAGSGVWDVTGSLQEFYGAGLFSANNTDNITIKWTNSNPSVIPDCWTQMSTTIPFIPVKPQPPAKPTVDWHYHHVNLNLTPQKDVNAQYHYDELDTSLPPMEQKVNSNKTLVNTKNDNHKTTLQKGALADDGQQAITAAMDGKNFATGEANLQLKDHDGFFKWVVNASIDPSTVKSAITLSDPLNAALTPSVNAQNIKVFDSTGKDVTKDFKISLAKGNDGAETVNAVADSNIVNTVKSSHSNVQYQLVIGHLTLKGISPDAAAKVMNSNGQLTIPNTAYITTDGPGGGKTPSNPATVLTPTPNEPPTAVNKTVALMGSKDAGSQNLNLPSRDAKYQYTITANIRPLDVKQTLILDDPMNNVQSASINAQNVHIYDQSGKDVTNQFKVSVNKNKDNTDVRAVANSSVINAVRNSQSDVQYKMVIGNVSLTGAAQSDIDGVTDENGQIKVPNVADIITDSSNPKSPQTTVTTPKPNNPPTSLHKDVFAGANTDTKALSKQQTSLTLHQRDDAYHYEITATVNPLDVRESFTIDDPMNNVQTSSVKAQNVHVYDNNGKDVTKDFKVTVTPGKANDDVKLVANKATAEAVHAAQTDTVYHIAINGVSLKSAAQDQLDGLTNNNGQIDVPNVATIITDGPNGANGKNGDGDTHQSNKTDVLTPPAKTTPSTVRKAVFTQATPLKTILSDDETKLTQNQQQVAGNHTQLSLKDRNGLYQYAVEASVRPADVQKSLVISDPMNNVQQQSVNLQNVHVYDNSGKDVTKDFTLKLDKSNGTTDVIATANTATVNAVHAATSNVNFKLVISNVSLKGATPEELANVKGYDGSLVVPNVAQLTTDKGGTTRSNQTRVNTLTPKNPASSLHKSVALGNYKPGEQNANQSQIKLQNKDANYHYVLTAQIRPSDVTKTLVISDPLNVAQSQSISAQNVKVYNGQGADVTKDFKVAVDKNANAANVSATANAQIVKSVHDSEKPVVFKLVIDNVSLKGASAAQLKSITNANGQITVPNTGLLTTDAGKTPSNTTNVTTPNGAAPANPQHPANPATPSSPASPAGTPTPGAMESSTTTQTTSAPMGNIKTGLSRLVHSPFELLALLITGATASLITYKEMRRHRHHA